MLRSSVHATHKREGVVRLANVLVGVTPFISCPFLLLLQDKPAVRCGYLRLTTLLFYALD